MCKSRAEGGQRCAAHTRPAYEATDPSDPAWDDAAAQYASTPEGRRRLIEQAETAAAARDYDTEARLRTAILRGADIRDANAEAASAIAHADLTTWDPVDIDTELARLHGEAYTLRTRRDAAYQDLNRSVAREVYGRGWRGTATRAEVEAALEDIRALPERERSYNQRQMLDSNDRIDNITDNLHDAETKMAPYNKEFTRRGGWPRAFLVVTNGQGHVHSSMGCSTCHPTTQFHWVTEMSNKTEGEIVEAAGERACSVCFPSAPVELRNRPTSLFTPQEREQQRARVERAEAAQRRASDRVAKALTPDGSEFRVECTRNGYPVRERFKTERTATTWMVSNMAYYRGAPPDRTMDPSMEAAHEQIIQAIAAKHSKSVADVRADIERKVVEKIRRPAR